MAWYRVFSRITCFWTVVLWRSKCWARLQTSAAQYVRWRVKVRIMHERQIESGVDRSHGICTIRTWQLQHLKWALGKGLDYLGIGIRFAERQFFFSLPHSVLSDSRVNHGHRFLFSVFKGGRSMKLNVHQHLAAKLSIRGAIPALPHMTSWRGVSLAVMKTEPKQRQKSRFISIYRVAQKPLDIRRCLNIWTTLYSVLAVIFNRCRKGTVGPHRTLSRSQIKLYVEIFGCCSAHIVIIIIIIIIIFISPLRRVFKIVYLQQTTFLGYMVLQLFCSYNLWYIL